MISKSCPLANGGTPPFSRPTWIEIDLDALRWNVRALGSLSGPEGPLIAVVKADAYGHGVLPVAQALLKADEEGEGHSPARVCMLAVASVDEGLQLREAGISCPILLLSAILPGEAQAAVQANLTPTVFTRELAAALDAAAGAEGQLAEAHLKIDTGMGRLGVPVAEAASFYRSLGEFRLLRVTGIYTHFACADEVNDNLSEEQWQMFRQALQECGPLPGIMVHAANSAALLRYPKTRFMVARPGLALYGISPLPDDLDTPVELRPVMSLKSRVTHVKTIAPGTTVSYGATWRATERSYIATVPVGYADGYPRCLSNKAWVHIHNTRCPVIGRVTMDQILVDCTRIASNLHLGDSVTLFGAELPVEDVASWAGTIPYEILCGIAHRVPRIYGEGNTSN